MENLELWKASAGCVCYIGRKYNVTGLYLSSGESKKQMNAVVKLLEKDGFVKTKEIDIIGDCKFEVRITPSLGLEVRNPNLPNPSEWYLIFNWMEGVELSSKLNYIGDLLSSVNVKEGVIESELEPVFSTVHSKAVSFICPEMSIYQKCMDELERKVKLEYFSKKTTKWIPGHRYDNELKSFYYIGQAKLRIEGLGTKSETLDTSDKIKSGTNVYLALSSAPKDLTNPYSNVIISNLEEKKFNTLLGFSKQSRMADMGEWIDDIKKLNITDPLQFKTNLILKTIDACKKKTQISPSTIKVSFSGFEYLLFPLLLYFEDNDCTLAQLGNNVRDNIIEVINIYFNDICETNYKRNTGSSSNNITNCGDSGARTLADLFLQNCLTEDSEYLKDSQDYKKLIHKILLSIGIDLEQLAKDFLSVDPIDVWKSSWENYISHSKYIIRVNKGNYFISLKNKSITSDSTKADTYKALSPIKSSALRESLKEIIQWVVDNNYSGITKCELYPPKNKKFDGWVDMRITAIDIENYYFINEKPMPFDLQTSIINTNFWYADIEADINHDWGKEEV